MPIKCKICNVDIQDEAQYQTHIQGKKHLNNAQHVQQIQSLAERSIFVSRLPQYLSSQNVLQFFSQFGEIQKHRFGPSHIIIEYLTKYGLFSYYLHVTNYSLKFSYISIFFAEIQLNTY